MRRQKSFDNGNPTLYIVATPIGNLSEMTPRAIEILRTVDVIAAEDTRNTMKLMHHFDIHTKVIAHHMHNEKNSAKGLIDMLHEGKSVAIVSDAGYPLLSDPGLIITQMVIEEGYNVVPISGSNAMLNALVASGISVQPFMFYGFLKSTEKERIKELHELKDYRCTIILYEAPHRLHKTLHNIMEIMGNRYLCIARELTKKHEEFIRGNVEELLEIVDELKGEIVLVIEGCREIAKEQKSFVDIQEQIDLYIKEEGYTTKDAIKRVAKETGLSRNEIYNEYHKLN